MKTRILSFVLLISNVCLSQTFDGKALYWEIKNSKTDDSVEVKYRSTGINIGGYEGTSAVIQNKSSQNITVEMMVTITDNCGKSSSRSFAVTVKANSTVGGNTWMGGNEQLDYSSQCASKKEHAKNFKSFISDVEMEVIKIWRGNGPIKRTKPIKSMGTEIEYLKGNGNTIIAKGKSYNRDVVTVLRYVDRQEKEVVVIEVLPGGTFTQKINCSDCFIEISFKPHKVPAESIADKLKQKVKEHLKVKENGEINYEGKPLAGSRN